MSVVENSVNTSIQGPRTMASGTSGFIIGPVMDSVLIIGAPIIALLIAAPLFSLPASAFATSFRTNPIDLRIAFVTVFIQAHLFLVFLRSHGNPTIFWSHPYRFTVVPIGVFLIGAFSQVALVVIGIVAVWWDVYHSSLQTFGFGRIYDAKLKNDALAGRSLDFWMNLLMYTGPVLAGAHFVDHLKLTKTPLEDCFEDGNRFGELLLKQTPDFLLGHQDYLAAAILAVGVPFMFYYLYFYFRLCQQGYQVSWQKVWLLIITSAVSIYTWGFRSFIDAFWVMNFFHALQYFAIVIFSEKKNLVQLFRGESLRYGGLLCSFWVIAFTMIYGVWAGYFVEGGWRLSLTLTTSVMHFWYDGFVWSVKKKQV